MAHQIALSYCTNKKSLYVAYLNGATNSGSAGNLSMFEQSAWGVWQACAAPALPSGVSGFSDILGLDNLLLAVSTAGSRSAGTLYYSIPSSTGGWTQFSALGAVGVNGMSAVWVPNVSYQNQQALLVGVLEYNQTLIATNVISLYGTPGSMTSKTVFTSSALGDLTGVNRLSVAVRNGANAGVVLLVDGGSALYCYIDVSGNGTKWVPVAASSGIIPTPFLSGAAIPSVVAVQGNPGADLDAILLANLPSGAGTPWLLTNAKQEWATNEQSSNPDTLFGNAWQSYGVIPTQTPVTPPLSMVAAAPGYPVSGGHQPLQVIGLGKDNLLYLITQDTAGNWHANNNPALPNPQSTQFQDIAVGLGSDRNKPALQVGCLGTDGHVYITWQRDDGKWFWYPGLSGSGLP